MSIPLQEGRLRFGDDPATYDRARPQYRGWVFEHLIRECGLGPGSRVCEIGAGTGRATRELLAAGAYVTAVEPDARLAEYLRERLAGEAIEAVVAPFEEAELPPGFAMVFAATSFHWIEPVSGLAKAARLLERGGWLALLWDSWSHEGRNTPFHNVNRHILGPLRTFEGPQGFSPGFDRVGWSTKLAATGSFGPLHVRSEEWVLRLTARETRDVWSGMSGITRLPRAEQERVLDGLEACARENFGEALPHPITTTLYTAQRV